MLGLTATDAAQLRAGGRRLVAGDRPDTVALEREAADSPYPGSFRAAPRRRWRPAARLGVDQRTNLELARDASPVTYAVAAAGPVLLIHGTDGLVNSGQSLALHEALLSAGQDSQLLLLAGANHEDPAYHKPAVLAATAGFFSALL